MTLLLYRWVVLGGFQANDDYKSGQIKAFVADITQHDLTQSIPERVDMATLIFVLSAIHPAKMPQALRNIRKVSSFIYSDFNICFLTWSARYAGIRVAASGRKKSGLRFR